MTKLLQRVDVTLRSFYVFNSQFGKTDGEEDKKIIYYFPDDIEINTKIKDVGLSEAIIAFTSTFTEAPNDCKSLHTQKTTQVFYQPEPSYWMVLVLNVPKEIRSKDGIDVTDYRGGEVHEQIYRSFLERYYEMFRLFNGTFHMNYESCGPSSTTEEKRLHLQQKLKIFYDKFISSLKLPVCDILDMMRSLQYLALDKCLFLNAHNFVNTILASFPLISEAILLYKEQVVCGGKISPLDLYCLHKYILDEELLMKMPLTEVTGSSGTVLSRSNSTITEYYRNGAFIIDPNRKSDESSTTTTPSLSKLYLSKGSAIIPYNILIYRALDAVMCLFLKTESETPHKEFYDEIHSYMGEKLASISRDISESLTKTKQGTNGTNKSTSTTTGTTSSGNDCAAPKYLFINEQSFKHLSNITLDPKRPQLSLGNVTANVLQIIADLDDQDRPTNKGPQCASNFAPAAAAFKETLVKTTNDFWVVKRCCNWRKYYVIISNNKSTLLDVSAEAMRIFERELTDDVFFDK